MTPKLVVDVCGTLYTENTTAGFVRFAARAGILRQSWRFRLLETLRRTPARKAVILLGRLVGRDLFRTGYIKCLAEARRASVEVQAAAYAEHLQDAKRISPVDDRLRKFEAEGWEPVLVSNSLDVVVAAIAQKRGYHWLASELTWHGDICGGTLARDLKGRKLKAFEEAFGTYPANLLAVMTDNRSDADVINAADTAVLVAEGQQKSWMKQYVSEQIYY